MTSSPEVEIRREDIGLIILAGFVTKGSPRRIPEIVNIEDVSTTTVKDVGRVIKHETGIQTLFSRRNTGVRIPVTYKRIRWSLLRIINITLLVRLGIPVIFLGKRVP